MNITLGPVCCHPWLTLLLSDSLPWTGAFFVVPEDGTASWINAIANPSQAAVAPGAELRRMTLGSTVRPLAATRANDDAPHTTPSAAGFHPDSKPGLQIAVDAAGDGGIVSKPGDTLAMFYTGAWACPLTVSSASLTPCVHTPHPQTLAASLARVLSHSRRLLMGAPISAVLSPTQPLPLHTIVQAQSTSRVQRVRRASSSTRRTVELSTPLSSVEARF